MPGGHRLERDREYHAELRAAFFEHGLHAVQTEALLRAITTGESQGQDVYLGTSLNTLPAPLSSLE